MKFRRVLALLLAVCLFPALGARAAEVESGGIYCFSPGDFPGDALTGVCITQLPTPELGTVMLEERIIRPGDVLTAQQLARLTFLPARREQDAQATIGYLGVFAGRVEEEAVFTISIRGRENKAPVAEDFAAETYKNLPLEGNLKVSDPEGDAIVFTLVRQPKRGTVELREDGSFTYTPKKNKVGIDSFVYTATDASGKVSRETTVTITIVKPTDSTQYTDTVGLDCRFAAEWMKNTGIFVGETLDGNACFGPEKEVTRGQFLAMLVRTLDIPLEEVSASQFADQPQWLRPYLAAALRSGLTAGLVEADPQDPITGAEATAMIHNALGLSIETLAEEAPQEAQSVLAALSAREDQVLTRSQAALALYETARLAREAPGMIVIARQR